MKTLILTYPENHDSLKRTVESVLESDLDDVETIYQPSSWLVGRESGTRNYYRALVKASEYAYTMILEDDVLVNRFIGESVQQLINKLTPDFLGLFMPSTVESPWKKEYQDYRIANPVGTETDDNWLAARIWGSQGYVLSKRLVEGLLDHWDKLHGGQDSRVLEYCYYNDVTLFYSNPCLVEHNPLRSSMGTPPIKACDFRRK